MAGCAKSGSQLIGARFKSGGPQAALIVRGQVNDRFLRLNRPNDIFNGQCAVPDQGDDDHGVERQTAEGRIEGGAHRNVEGRIVHGGIVGAATDFVNRQWGGVMTRRLSGLTPDPLAAGLVVAARHYGVDPLKVFSGRKVRHASRAVQATASALIGALEPREGLVTAVARVFGVMSPTRLAPCELKRAEITPDLQETILEAMLGAGLIPQAVALVDRPGTAKPTPRKPAPTPLAIEALPPFVKNCVGRWLKAFNAGELTLNLVRDRLRKRMIKEGLDDALCPSLQTLHRAARAQRQAEAEARRAEPEAPAVVPTPRPFNGRQGFVVLDELARAERPVRTAKTTRRIVEAAPTRAADVHYGHGVARPLELGEGDRRLVQACLSQGGFPRAVALPSGVTAWASHDDKPWRFCP